MGLVLVMVVMLVGGVCGQDPPANRVVAPRQIDSVNSPLTDTDLILAFVIFRHGDRTPDEEELEIFPRHLNNGVFFPYGKKALTNKGKQRSYLIGKYLRELYNGLISNLYLPDEIVVRTTDFARTKMTALTALAGLYPPPPAQKWNPNLNWQPIPYDTPPFDEDDLLYWYNCPRYIWLRNKTYERPDVKKWIEPYQTQFSYLSSKTNTNITTTDHIFFLDNLFQTLLNVGVKPPEWAQEVMAQIKSMTKIEYAVEFYNAELVQLTAGVLMQSILNTTSSVIAGNIDLPKMYLYSAHENNVAALMAAARVFEAHQPNYGATFSLELRRKNQTGEYGISAVYAKDAGGPGEILPIGGCGGELICNYDKFVSLMQDVVWSKDEMDQRCKILTEL